MENGRYNQALNWIELAIASGINTLGTFEWPPDISNPGQDGDDGDNEKDKGQTKETETQDHDAGTSSDGVIELTSVFQSFSKLEAYTTKYMENNKRSKIIVKFQDNTKLNLTPWLLKWRKDAKGATMIFRKTVYWQELYNESDSDHSKKTIKYILNFAEHRSTKTLHVNFTFE